MPYSFKNLYKEAKLNSVKCKLCLTTFFLFSRKVAFCFEKEKLETALKQSVHHITTLLAALVAEIANKNASPAWREKMEKLKLSLPALLAYIKVNIIYGKW